MSDDNGSTNGYASRDALLALASDRRRYVDVEIRGSKYRLRSLNDKEWTRLQASNVKKDGTLDRIKAQTNNVRTIIACVVDGNGETLFTDNDVDALRTIDAGVIQELAEACSSHIGIGDDDEGN